MTIAGAIRGAISALRWPPTDFVTSAAAYATIAVYDVRALPRCQMAFVFTENNVNAVEFKVRGSVDGKAWVDLTILQTTGAAFAAADIDVSNASVHGFTDDSSRVHPAYGFFDVQLRDNVSGTHGSGQVAAVAKAI